MHPRFAIGMGEVANSKGEGEGANLLFDQSPPQKTRKMKEIGPGSCPWRSLGSACGCMRPSRLYLIGD